MDQTQLEIATQNTSQQRPEGDICSRAPPTHYFNPSLFQEAFSDYSNTLYPINHSLPLLHDFSLWYLSLPQIVCIF